jgi:hypothetical protein
MKSPSHPRQAGAVAVNGGQLEGINHATAICETKNVELNDNAAMTSVIQKCWLVWNVKRRGVGGPGTSREEVLVALGHRKKRCWWFRNVTRRSVGGVGTSQGAHNKRSWWPWNGTRRSARGFGTSQVEVLVLRNLTRRIAAAFGASQDTVLVVSKHLKRKCWWLGT